MIVRLWRGVVPKETVEHFEVLEAVTARTDLPTPASGSDADSR